MLPDGLRLELSGIKKKIALITGRQALRYKNYAQCASHCCDPSHTLKSNFTVFGMFSEEHFLTFGECISFSS